MQRFRRYKMDILGNFNSDITASKENKMIMKHLIMPFSYGIHLCNENEQKLQKLDFFKSKRHNSVKKWLIKPKTELDFDIFRINFISDCAFSAKKMNRPCWWTDQLTYWLTVWQMDYAICPPFFLLLQIRCMDITN